ncbi:MAG: hypothetical protein IJK60_00615 [Clostridia bacterium]|nr:hypothetical protein [Clostridia bacterium]
MNVYTGKWDNIILTVGSRRQKNLCEKLLSDMREKLPVPITVIADDEQGCRLGSGGAMLNVIDTYCMPGKKVMLINSGGMSKRSVCYAVRGKAFADIGSGNEAVTLLELIVSEANRLSGHIKSGLMVSCSDILVKTGSFIPEFNNSVGFCVRTDFQTGSRHGVMIKTPDGRLKAYPHKVNADELEKICRENGDRFALVDTGFSYFSPEFITAAKQMVKETAVTAKLRGAGMELNLYSDIITLLCETADREAYLNEPGVSKTHREFRKILYGYFSPLSMNVCEIAGNDFLHFGTNSESLKNIKSLSDGARSGFISVNSILSTTSRCSAGTVLDNALIGENCTIGKNSFACDVALDNLSVGDETLVCGMKLTDGSYVTLVCPVDENPKDEINGRELWKTPRFFKGRSFSDSYRKFKENSADEKVSMQFCVENADYDYYAEHRKYINDLRNAAKWNPEEYTKARAKVLDEYFGRTPPVKELECTCDNVSVALPVRVNLSGTWTDALPYCTDNGGQVINMAAKVDGILPITVKAEKLEDKHLEFCNDNTVISLLPEEIDKIEVKCGFSDFNLHLAALKTIGVTKDTAIKNGFRLTTQVTGIAKGSGLGTSSILLTGCFRALGRLFAKDYSDDEIINMVFVAEQLMNTGGGWQDQAGGITPSIKITTAQPGIPQKPEIRYIDVPDDFMPFFSQRLCLVSTGERHFGRFMVNSVMGRYLSGDPVTLKAFKELKELNAELEKGINNGDEKVFADCVNRQWSLLKELSPDVTDVHIDKIVNECKKSADALCICGAGAGGYLLAVLKKDVSFEDFRQFIFDNPLFDGIKDPVKKITAYL